MGENRKFYQASLLVLGVLIVGLVLSNGRAAQLWAMMPESGVTKQRRADAAWYQYRADHHCALTGNTRDVTTYHRTYLISSSSTVTKYEWKCDGGDTHWTR